MEKLERVLMAEDDAREALEDARTESVRVRAAAIEESRRLEADAVRDCDATIAAEREATLAEARSEAERIAREAADLRGSTLTAARGRLDDAVRRIAESLEA